MYGKRLAAQKDWSVYQTDNQVKIWTTLAQAATLSVFSTWVLNESIRRSYGLAAKLESAAGQAIARASAGEHTA
jgi:hypothetical protein